MKHVLLMTNEAATVSAVTSALESNGQLDPRDVCRNLTELTARLERGNIPVALVDIEEQPRQMLAAVESLARRFTDTRFAVLSGALNRDLLLLVMRSGVRDCLEKKAIPDDLAGVLKRLCPRNDAAQKGSLVTVLSAGGGCGATTFAVNLADELARLPAPPPPAPPSLIVDLDYCYGAVGSYLSLDGEYGLLDLLNRTDPIDAQLIRSTAISTGHHVHALLGTARERLGDAVAMDEQRIGEALEACKCAYRWTVVDAPRLPGPIAAEVVRRSDITFIVLQLTIKDLRVARQMLATLSQHVPGAPVQLLVGRYCGRRQLISVEESREALGISATDALVCLHNDYDTVSKAVNFGKPLAEVAKHSTLRRDVQKLAANLVQTCHPQEMPDRVTPELAFV